jgi:hypothetical protein
MGEKSSGRGHRVLCHVFCLPAFGLIKKEIEKAAKAQ